MSAPKSTAALGANDENATKITTPTATAANEKETKDATSEGDAENSSTPTQMTSTTQPTTPTTTSTTTALNQINETIKGEPVSPTQKMGSNASSNRVTRKSPLTLTSPTHLKKDQHGIDSEPNNSESEDNTASLTKKPIRGRKSIKDKDQDKEIAVKEAAIEETDTPDIGVEEKCDIEIQKITTAETSTEIVVEIENSVDDLVKSDDDVDAVKEQKEGEEQTLEKDIKLKDLKENENVTEAKVIKVQEEKEMDPSTVREIIIGKSARDPKEWIDVKDAKDAKESTTDAKDGKKPKETKDAKEPKELKDTSKDIKAIKDIKESATKETVSNRITRHAVAQENASKTRITRNRQASSGSATRPETPPVTAGRRNRAGANTRKTNELQASQKRKRSVEERSETPVSKIIKLEPKDLEDDAMSSEPSNASVGNVDIESVKIKQELIESDDGSSTTAEGSNVTASTSLSTMRTRNVRGAWNGRKPTQAASPSTRSTRQSKTSSPAASTISSSEPKRRRTAGGNNSANLRRSASASLLKTSTQTVSTGNQPATADDDSKDSTASLADDIQLAAAVKFEQLTPEIDEDANMEHKAPHEDDEKLEEQKTTSLTQFLNGVEEPLSIETEAASIPTPTNALTEKPVKREKSALAVSGSSSSSGATGIASGSNKNKDASLSPELVSEGVSEISVKQFYKRPEFLENNLGIEEDPKLGEIVQKVTVEIENDAVSTTTTTTMVATKTENTLDEAKKAIEAKATAITNEIDEIGTLNESFSAESLKEGELVYEENSDNDKKSLTEDAETAKQTASDKILKAETKNEDDLMQEPLQLDEEDEDDEEDDMTAEESETISMDNNPSLHDENIDDDDDEQVEEAAANLPNAIFAEIDEVAQDIGLAFEILNDVNIKETSSNACDNEKAKLKKEKEEKSVVKVVVSTTTTALKNVDEKEAENKKIQPKRTSISNGNSIAKEKKIKLAEENKLNAAKVRKTAATSTLPPVELKKEIQIPEEAAEILKTTETDDVNESKLENLNKVVVMEIDDDTAKADETVSPLEANQSDGENSNMADSPKAEQEEEKPPILLSESVVENVILKKCESIKDEDENVSVKSAQSTETNNSWSTIEQENLDEEQLRQKEKHLQNLGLLTHKAAEKRRQEEEASRVAAAQQHHQHHHHSKRNGGKSSAAVNTATSHEYTGTLKTVIKLNRNSSGAATGTTTTLTAVPSSMATAAAASTSNGSNISGNAAGNSRSKSNISNAKPRQSLKITFQKGRGRATQHGSERNNGANNAHGIGPTAHGEDSYYTIQNENEGAHKNSSGSSMATSTAGTKDQQLRIQNKQQNYHNNHNNNNNNNKINNYNHCNNNNNIRNTSNVQTHVRKSYYNSRSNANFSYNYNHHYATHIDSLHSEGNNDQPHYGQGGVGGHGPTSSGAAIGHKKDDREEILIPEKASSFKFHPGRLCEDQCYYCSGKFGLYDTPCHVGQIKSVERQLKILNNEEKLTVDNCLCDACFRHVDRRANVPSYKKRLSASGHLENVKNTEDSVSNKTASGVVGGDESTTNATEVVRKCVVPDCVLDAAHSLRRKCIRKSVKKYLLNFDMPTGSPYIWLCQNHYDAVIQCSGCVLCKRRLGKNHMYHITSDTERLEKALTDMGIPVQLGIGTAVCKLCRYFANLLMKPPDSTKSQKAEFVKNYRKRLLQFHNINDVSNEVSDADEDENVASTSKAAKRAKKDEIKDAAGSPTASSNSSLVCVNENANDSAGASAAALANSQSLADHDGSLDFSGAGGDDVCDEETSNEHSSKDSTGQTSRLKAILQSSGAKDTNHDLPSALLLRSNPSLSMRELFPGEEDLGLNFKAPFGSSNSQRTPEGWTRVQTFLQYDEPTRRLWEELQKPYGNQSSFLRHLILLEKYYRNGDLVLSPNASSNASVYTQTVRQRLSSYDEGHCGGLHIQNESPSTKSKEPSPAKEQKSKDYEAVIPLVEINDDDDDNNEMEPQNKIKSKRNADADVEEDKQTAKTHSRSISVDKLTQQLSTNAVTIIARPKDTQQQIPTRKSTPDSVEQLMTTTTAALMTPKRSDATNKSISSPASGSKMQANTQSGSANASAASIVGCNSIPGSIATGSNNSGIGNSRSILKSNLLGIAGNKSVEILPISNKSNKSIVTATTVNIPSVATTAAVAGVNDSATGTGITKQQKILEVANKLLGTQLEAAAAAAAANVSSSSLSKPHQNNPLLTSPPELVSLQRRSAGSSSSSAPTPTTLAPSSASASASSTTTSLINAKRAHLMPNRLAAKPPPNVVILPDTLNAHERAESKSWRPTLMSVEENQHLLNKNGPLYQTADGRRLPGLVQVQSGGKPFLISIFDYNRMCILRREKLLRDQMLKAGKHSKSQQQQHHHHQNQHQLQQQQQQQRNSGQTHSNANFNNKINTSGSHTHSHNSSSNAVNVSKHVQAAAQQQLMQLMQFHSRHQQQQQQHQAALKNAAGPSNSGGRGYMNIAPKPQLIPTSSSMMSSGSNNNVNAMNSRLNSSNQASAGFPMPLLANALTNVTAAAAGVHANVGNAAAAAAATLNSAPWLWNNFPDAHDLLRNGTGAGANKMPPLLPKPTSAPATITSKQLQQQQQHHQQLLMDNNLMSKIPKSLTVIPQQKLMGGNNNRGGSKE